MKLLFSENCFRPDRYALDCNAIIVSFDKLSQKSEMCIPSNASDQMRRLNISRRYRGWTLIYCTSDVIAPRSPFPPPPQRDMHLMDSRLPQRENCIPSNGITGLNIGENFVHSSLRNRAINHPSPSRHSLGYYNVEICLVILDANTFMLIRRCWELLSGSVNSSRETLKAYIISLGWFFTLRTQIEF